MRIQPKTLQHLRMHAKMMGTRMRWKKHAFTCMDKSFVDHCKERTLIQLNITSYWFFNKDVASSCALNCIERISFIICVSSRLWSSSYVSTFYVCFPPWMLYHYFVKNRCQLMCFVFTCVITWVLWILALIFYTLTKRRRGLELNGYLRSKETFTLLARKQYMTKVRLHSFLYLKHYFYIEKC